MVGIDSNGKITRQKSKAQQRWWDACEKAKGAKQKV